MGLRLLLFVLLLSHCFIILLLFHCFVLLYQTYYVPAVFAENSGENTVLQFRSF